MKKLLLNGFIAAMLLLIPNVNYAQAPPLGTAADYVLFTSVGAMTNVGISHLTGNVGTNSGSITGFGNVNGVMNSTNGATGQCSADLLNAYNLLNSAIPTFFPAPLLGNGDTLNAGIYAVSAASTLNLNLYLNAQGDPNAVFIFQIAGPLSVGANAKVKLINGALACKVFWKVEGLVSMASGISMKGTVIANNAAINMNTNDTLEGRALSTAGAVTVNGVMSYTPIGCGSPTLTGPGAVNLVSTACYTIFSSDGAVTNAGVTNVTGDVGTNVGLTTGFNALNVTGAIHPIPDGSTAACAADLIGAYNYLNTLPADIELLYPAQFGLNLVLTPHTYLMNGGVTFTDSLFLNAMGNPNAVFVIQINGALSTSTFAKVILINGTQAKNVFWKVDGAVSINDYSVFNGTIVCNNGAVNLNTGVQLNGRAFTTTGTLTTAAITAIAPPGCGNSGSTSITSEPSAQSVCAGSSASFSVTATGTGLTYHWRKGLVNLANSGTISGTTSNVLTINPASISDAATNYNVVITDSAGIVTTSANAALVINTASVSPVITGPNAVCGIIHPVYTATAAGASSFTWTAPAGIAINSGQGTSSITTTISGNSPSWTITCSTTNSCSTSTAGSLVITKKPQTPSTISGPVDICGMTSATYSIATTFGATSYTWTIPTGMTITSGAGTTSVTVSIASSFIEGSVRVMAVNACGSIPGTSLLVYGKVSPSTISGPANVCGMTSASYSCNTVVNATSYNWAVPNGWTIATGQGTTMITATLPANVNNITFSGAVKVAATSTCGNSAAKSLTVNYCKSALTMNNEKGDENNISNLYPNPTTSEFTIDITSDVDKDIVMEVYDILGNKVIQQKHNLANGQSSLKINVEQLINGIYFVRLTDANSDILFTERVVKQ